MPRWGKRQAQFMATGSAEFAPWLGVFETLRVINGIPLFVAEHREELERAMEALGLQSDEDIASAASELPPRSGRWRWIVTPQETRMLFSEEEATSQERLTLSVSPVRVGSCNWDARFKTLSYLSHVQAWKSSATSEAVLLNEQGHVASASRGNIFWRRGDRLFTPAHEAGCRCGVVRAFVAKHQRVETGHFPITDLLEAEEIFVTNSIKGIASVAEFGGRSFTAFPSADRLRDEYAAAVAAQIKR
jgi:branched-subunit amino acid aminotransferase/4-amino-4-deoxychorismate lyase